MDLSQKKRIPIHSDACTRKRCKTKSRTQCQAIYRMPAGLDTKEEKQEVGFGFSLNFSFAKKPALLAKTDTVLHLPK